MNPSPLSTGNHSLLIILIANELQKPCPRVLQAEKKDIRLISGFLKSESPYMLFRVFKKYFIYLFLERGREGEREEEKHQCVVASHVPPTGDLAHNPGTCPDWELNWRPFDLQASAQSTEPHQPGRFSDSDSTTIVSGPSLFTRSLHLLLDFQSSLLRIC